ncbi:hypothetical protein EVAR_62288_1 [Eumeta japonica]|uniref:Uncharacterized protein n=1 Tax=Eumeta variegata TaxID=151549 RepID=A0A4C1ZUX2_EUMVA|nr:hypothetical protein EVAR_62288_1 [Eumeta japonica]
MRVTVKVVIVTHAAPQESLVRCRPLRNSDALLPPRSFHSQDGTPHLSVVPTRRPSPSNRNEKIAGGRLPVTVLLKINAYALHENCLFLFRSCFNKQRQTFRGHRVGFIERFRRSARSNIDRRPRPPPAVRRPPLLHADTQIFVV